MCPEALFAFYMGRANNGPGVAGEVTICGTDPAHYKIQSLAGATVNAQGAYEIECNTTSSLPALIFTLGDQDFTLQGSEYIVQVNQTCVLGLLGLDLPPPIAQPPELRGPPTSRPSYAQLKRSEILVQFSINGASETSPYLMNTIFAGFIRGPSS
ncbi:unnamed protein product [Haemonchus placei]|uniref:Peptidase A1 domain-containing protein n=1 Tax=Haemonchus placei TaxID=6290 RepID=A0A0N4WPG4_HAEPC|nr:unnamed protein product [Haemonchus placei]